MKFLLSSLLLLFPLFSNVLSLRGRFISNQRTMQKNFIRERASFATNMVGSAGVSVIAYSRIFADTDTDTDLEEIQVFEPESALKNETTCVLFFSGGNALMPYEIYSNVLNKIAGKNLAVYVPRFKYKNIDELIATLEKEYAAVVPVSHSSGVNELIDKCGKYKSIRKMVLLDPVDIRLMKTNKLKMKNIDDVLFIMAAKSYAGKPTFIPAYFALDEDSFIFAKNASVKTVEYAEHGHCDILNNIYSNMMFRIKICDGLDSRKPSLLNDYHINVANDIADFINATK